MAMMYLLITLGLLISMPFGADTLKYAESSHLPIQLQCSCPFVNVIKVGEISYMSPGGQWTPAENINSEIEDAADHECRQQLGEGSKKCDLYLKGFNVHMGSGAKVVISYECLADSSDHDIAFSEDTDDVTLQCSSKKNNIDIKEIKVEDGQVALSVLNTNQDCAQQFAFQKMFNLVPLVCNVKREDRQGCILVRYKCEESTGNGGSPVFPPPPGFGR